MSAAISNSSQTRSSSLGFCTTITRHYVYDVGRNTQFGSANPVARLGGSDKYHPRSASMLTTPQAATRSRYPSAHRARHCAHNRPKGTGFRTGQAISHPSGAPSRTRLADRRQIRTRTGGKYPTGRATAHTVANTARPCHSFRSDRAELLILDLRHHTLSAPHATRAAHSCLTS